MSNPPSFEERIGIARDAFAALIAADEWIVSAPAVPVVTEAKGDVATMVAQSLAKLGLCIVVVAADGDKLTRTGDRLMMRVRLVAQVSEKVLINQSACIAANVPYRPALSCAVRVMKAVDRKPNGLDFGQHYARLNEFELADDRPFELVANPTDAIYNVSAYTQIEL